MLIGKDQNLCPDCHCIVDNLLELVKYDRVVNTLSLECNFVWTMENNSHKYGWPNDNIFPKNSFEKVN